MGNNVEKCEAVISDATMQTLTILVAILVYQKQSRWTTEAENLNCSQLIRNSIIVYQTSYVVFGTFIPISSEGIPARKDIVWKK